MTEKRERGRSLNMKMLYAVLLSLILSLGLYFAVTGIGSLAIDKIYMSPDAVNARKADIYADINSFVTRYYVKGTDVAALARWTGSNRYVTVLVYNKRGDLIMRASDGEAQSSSNMQNYERLQYASLYGKLYPMRFADGVYSLAIGDNSRQKEIMINRAAALGISIICFFSCIFWRVHRLTDRIIRLSREAVNIAGGDLNGPIDTSGGDELAMLAVEMDSMRSSVIERMGNERRAWEANSELITAISHDIRTPMTSLTGYLELMKNDDFQDREKSRQFCASAIGKAQELKTLTDELFKYFLVFGRADLDMKMELMDARLLLQQLLGEAMYDLSGSGFKLRSIEFKGECAVKADPMYLKRVVDNLVSNVKKYADKEKSVVFLTELSDRTLTVCVSNSVPEQSSRVESTRIGIKTCEKIMEHMGGSFKTRRDEARFSAEFTLPALPPLEQE